MKPFRNKMATSPNMRCCNTHHVQDFCSVPCKFTSPTLHDRREHTWTHGHRCLAAKASPASSRYFACKASLIVAIKGERSHTNLPYADQDFNSASSAWKAPVARMWLRQAGSRRPRPVVIVTVESWSSSHLRRKWSYRRANRYN